MKKLRGIMLGMLVLVAGCILFSVPQQAEAAEKGADQSVVERDEIGVGVIMPSNAGAGPMVMAASNYSDGNASVAGDGIRLRKSPSKSATILELMYRGEPVLINYTKSSGKGSWFYVKRMKTGTWGWAYRQYIWEWD